VTPRDAAAGLLKRADIAVGLGGREHAEGVRPSWYLDVTGLLSD
jgi:hypothetical protein